MAAPPDLRWARFWEDQQVFDDLTLERNLAFFLERCGTWMPLSVEDVVLDLGCGTGALAHLLQGRVGEYHGADIAESSLAACRHRFQGAPGTFFHPLDPQRYTDLSALPRGRFTRIYCHSVVQYYDAVDRVQDLVEEVSRVAAPGARMLVADLPLAGRTMADLAAYLGRALRSGTLAADLALLVRARTSGYAALPRLEFTSADLERLARDPRVTVLRESLTVNPGRAHLLAVYP